MEEYTRIPNKNVETYAEDMAKVIEGNTEEGLIKRIIHQQEAEEEEKRNSSIKSRKNQFFLSLSVLLVVASFGTFIFFFVSREKIHTVEITPQATPIIFLDRNSFLDISTLSKEKIVQTVLNEVNSTEVKAGGVEGIYLTVDKNVIGLREFMLMIKGSLNITENEFINDNFLIGIANQDEKNLFILLQARATPDIFGSMRAWEPKMFYDLSEFFGRKVTAETNYLLSKDFEDAIVQNKNARVLRDKEGVIILMYVFADDKSVVVADSEEAVRIVKERLAAGEVKK